MMSSLLRLAVCTTIVLGACLAAAVQAQDREKFVISAQAGGVNSVTGRVVVRRTGQSEQLLTVKDNLISGDVVSTGAGARIEVLLNPGSYFRMTGSGEFELPDSSLDNLRLKLIRGSAILEATGFDDTEIRIDIVTEQSDFVIVRRGVYRFNVQPGSTEVLVRKGRVWIGNNPRQVVKSGNRITFNQGSFLATKLGKQEPDEFDNWSKQRAEALARANEKLSPRAVNGYLSSLNGFDGLSSRWGLWTYSSSLGCFTFLPFYYGWASPYGHYYGRYWGIYDYFPGGGCCNGGGSLREPVIVSNPSPRGSSGGPSGGGSPGRSNNPPPAPPPPLRDPDSGRIIRKLNPNN